MSCCACFKKDYQTAGDILPHFPGIDLVSWKTAIGVVILAIFYVVTNIVFAISVYCCPIPMVIWENNELRQSKKSYAIKQKCLVYSLEINKSTLQHVTSSCYVQLSQTSLYTKSNELWGMFQARNFSILHNLHSAVKAHFNLLLTSGLLLCFLLGVIKHRIQGSVSSDFLLGTNPSLILSNSTACSAFPLVCILINALEPGEPNGHTYVNAFEPARHHFTSTMGFSKPLSLHSHLDPYYFKLIINSL